MPLQRQSIDKKGRSNPALFYLHKSAKLRMHHKRIGNAPPWCVAASNPPVCFTFFVAALGMLPAQAIAGSKHAIRK
jgi:hypothetical protein